jgi:hypothetical protein
MATVVVTVVVTVVIAAVVVPVAVFSATSVRIRHPLEHLLPNNRL